MRGTGDDTGSEQPGIAVACFQYKRKTGKFQGVTGLCQLEQTLGVQIANFLSVGGTERGVIQEPAPLLVAAVGVVDGEDDAVGSQRLQGEQERGIGEEAAGGNKEIAYQVVGYGILQVF